MRWIALPLIAGLFMAGSGFMDALERTTDASVALAESSEDAPRTTTEARAEVGSLPRVADLTSQQAEAFDILADALETSATRVGALDASVEDQLAILGSLVDDIDEIDPFVTCVAERLRSLVATSVRGPQLISAISTVLSGVVHQQDRSIRHLRSINRKLTALGVIATATDVEPPPPPGEPPSPEPGSPGAGSPC